MNEYYIGLMSGTSVDGVDVVLADLGDQQTKIIETLYIPYDQTFREKILNICRENKMEINLYGELDVALGAFFAEAIQTLLNKTNIPKHSIKAIGSHGQTIRHAPFARFSLQIGDPNVIAARTGITTVADFRRKDLALGGQGAPLVPAFHQKLFASNTSNRVIVNIGGIANVTLLDKNCEQVIGYDTGPGNVLLDAWVNKNKNLPIDQDGIWAKNGTVNQVLLKRLLTDDYFNLSYPKSTGREYFNLSWLDHFLKEENIRPEDVQATLVELTAKSIIDAVRKHFAEAEILICGGGIHNQYLLSRLHILASNQYLISSTEKYGVHPDWVEALTFAWLAKQTLHKQSGNLPSVTGAGESAVLGGIYYS